MRAGVAGGGCEEGDWDVHAPPTPWKTTGSTNHATIPTGLIGGYAGLIDATHAGVREGLDASRPA